MTTLKPGIIVHLDELHASSPFAATPSQSLRVLGQLNSYDVETGIVLITEAGASLKVDTQLLHDVALRQGSLYQFIGELNFTASNEMVLQARVGRNVDGLDLKLYDKALQLRRQFEKEHVHA
ncbi:unnamed protein product [Sphagnum troendelagicum]|uniref:CST complex subunit TEN1 n=1 Tax=Sphagnum troendelagicum TaxID=128251 RepID=A0ABP0UIA1_9BRYO